MYRLYNRSSSSSNSNSSSNQNFQGSDTQRNSPTITLSNKISNFGSGNMKIPNVLKTHHQ